MSKRYKTVRVNVPLCEVQPGDVFAVAGRVRDVRRVVSADRTQLGVQFEHDGWYYYPDPDEIVGVDRLVEVEG